MDAREWEDFVQRHYQAIFAYCFQFFGRRAEAEDVTQEVFMKAFQSVGTLKDARAEKSWIYSVARNACIDKQRWWKRYLTQFRVAEEQEEFALEAPQDPELAQTLQRLIAQLPPKQREVFILRHWHGFSTADAAELLRIDEGTVKSHLKRAIDKLKSGLKELGY